MKTQNYRTGRGRRTSAKVRDRLVAEFRQEGATQADFCRERGLNAKTFARWLGQSEAQTEAVAVFAEIQVQPAPPLSAVEISLVNGIVIRIGEVSDVVGLAEGLQRIGASGC